MRSLPPFSIYNHRRDQNRAYRSCISLYVTTLTGNFPDVHEKHLKKLPKRCSGNRVEKGGREHTLLPPVLSQNRLCCLVCTCSGMCSLTVTLLLQSGISIAVYDCIDFFLSCAHRTRIKIVRPIVPDVVPRK